MDSMIVGGEIDKRITMSRGMKASEASSSLGRSVGRSPSSFNADYRLEETTINRRIISAREAEVLALKHESRISDSGPTLYVVQGRAKPVLHGPNSRV